MQALWALIGFILAIGVLTIVHEFGHFWVARKLGIKVLRFSIGMGKPLFSMHDKQGTEYLISALPIGGYVQMLDETEGIVPKNERHKAFNNKSVWARMAVIIAGPFFNFIFAIFAYWIIFIIGITSIAPIIGSITKGSISDIAGLRSGQEIIKIEDKDVLGWEQVSAFLMPYVGEKAYIKIKTKDLDNKIINTHTLNLSNWTVSNEEGDLLKSLGIEPFDPSPSIVGKVIQDYPAYDSGIQPGDIIIEADNLKVYNRSDLVSYIKEKPNEIITLKIKRDDEVLTVNVKPMTKLAESGEEIGFIGVIFSQESIPKEFIRSHKYGFFEAFSKALQKTMDYIKLILQFLYKMLIGKVSLEHIAGPISIAKYAGLTVTMGLNQFLSFLALVSISLGVLNLLPIPILDGGNFLFCVYELITGKGLSDRASYISRVIGILLLSALMMIAIINDIMKF